MTARRARADAVGVDTAQAELWSGVGSEVNPVKIGETNTLYGDPKRRLEKPHTIVRFPGGSVEIARTTDDQYWIHVAVHGILVGETPGRIVSARIDHEGRYNDRGNEALRAALAATDVTHIAFLVLPGVAPC